MKLIAHFKPRATVDVNWLKNGVELVAIEGSETPTPTTCRGCALCSQPHFLATPATIPDGERRELAVVLARDKGLTEASTMRFLNEGGIPLPMKFVEWVEVVE